MQDDQHNPRDAPSVNTAGGAYIAGDVSTGGADFTGRDKIIHNYTRSEQEQMDSFVSAAMSAYRNKLHDLAQADVPIQPYKFLHSFGLADRQIFFGRNHS